MATNTSPAAAGAYTPAPKSFAGDVAKMLDESAGPIITHHLQKNYACYNVHQLSDEQAAVRARIAYEDSLQKLRKTSTKRPLQQRSRQV